MRELSSERFAQQLLEKYFVSPQQRAGFTNSATSSLAKPLRDLWESSELSASEFADEVALYWQSPRLSLPQLLGSTALLDRFSRRFLREATVFPFQGPHGSYHLAVADPSDTAAIRAAEIVFGAPVEIAIGSFEDITTVLDERFNSADAKADSPKGESTQSDDDIESLRDLASGAPVVRAFNDMLERAVELRASDIHIEPLQGRPCGAHARRRPAARRCRRQPMRHRRRLISRIKILAGLNIAERRLPQDGAARLHVEPLRNRHSRRDDADAARRNRRHPPAAA